MAIVSITALCLSIITVITITLYFRGVFRLVFLASKIRGPSIWKVVTKHGRELWNGQVLTFLCEQCQDFSYKPVGLWTLSGNYTVLISDPNTFEEVYKSKQLIHKAHQVYGTVGEYAGRGMFVMNGERWKQHRKIGNPAFQKSLLEASTDIIFEGAENFMQELRNKATGTAFDMGHLLGEKLFDLQVRFFSSNDIVYPSTREFAETHIYMFRASILKFLNPVYHWLSLKLHGPTRKADERVRTFFKVNQAIFLKAIAESKAHLKNNSPPRSLIEHILQASESVTMDDQEICEEIMQLIFAASEPVATPIKGAILMIALHQDVQQRMHDEITQFLDKGQSPTIKDVNHLEYLGMVVKESLRLFPTGANLLRYARAETELDGETIPKGGLVVLNVMSLHRNPNCFEDPLKFMPERFSPENSKNRHPYSYLPFSYGTRNCIGQVHALNVMKVILFNLVRCYRILPGDDLKSVSDVKFSLRSTLAIKETSVKLINRV